MTVSDETGEANRVTDNLNVEVLSREDGVFEVINLSHDYPEDHQYKVFTEDEEAFHCTCPAFEHNSGLDDEGRCKHMRAVEQFVSQLHFRDWQQVQKERNEEERRQAMQESKQRVFADGGEVGDSDELTEVEQEILHEFGNAEPNDPETVVFTDEPTPSEQVELEEAVELSSGAKAAQEMVEEAKETAKAQMSKDEWREMSSEGRRRAVAFL